jgi:DNA topoisomerase-1
MKFDGWRKVIPAKKDSEEVVIPLPEVSKDENLDLIKTWGDQKFTQPPARFNEASLIKTLEKLGIGRPSTYAPTITVIQLRNYVEKNDSKQFVPTTIGIAVNDFLITNFPETFDYQFTAEMEGELDSVAEGKLPWVKTIKDFWKPFDKKLKDVEKNSKRVKIEVEKLGRKCPECGEGELVIRTGRFGKFISCDRFPDCKHTEKYLEKIGVKCPECKEGDVIIKKTSKGRKFFGCSRYPACKYASWRSPKKDDENSQQGTSS